MAKSAWDELEEVKLDSNNKPIQNFKSPWDELEEVNNPLEPIFNDKPLTFAEEHPVLYGGIKKLENATNDFSGALKNPVSNPNTMQGLGNVTRDLGQFGVGLVKGIPQFANEIANETKITTQNVINRPSNALNFNSAFWNGADTFLGDLISGTLNLPEAVAASYNNREYTPKFNIQTPIQTLQDKFAKNVLNDEAYKYFKQYKQQEQLGNQSLPLIGTAGQFLPAAIPIFGNISKGVTTPSGLVKNIAKSGAVGAGYGAMTNPQANLAERAKGAGAGFALGSALTAGGKAVQAGGKAAYPYIAKGVARTAYEAGKAARNVSDVAEEVANRLNPKNYKTVIDSVPVEKGLGLSRKTVYEGKLKKVYQNPKKITNDINPKETSKIVDNGTNFTMGESSKLKYTAPKTYAKQQMQKLLPNNKVISENVTNSISKIAPKTAEKQSIKSSVNIEEKEALKYAFDILSQATGKSAKYIRMVWNNPKRRENLEKILETSDRIDATEAYPEWAKYYTFDRGYGGFSEKTQDLIQQAKNVIDFGFGWGKNFDNPKYEYYEKMSDDVNESLRIIENSDTIENADKNIIDKHNYLAEKYADDLYEEEYQKLYDAYFKRIKELEGESNGQKNIYAGNNQNGTQSERFGRNERTILSSANGYGSNIRKTQQEQQKRSLTQNENIEEGSKNEFTATNAVRQTVSRKNKTTTSRNRTRKEEEPRNSEILSGNGQQELQQPELSERRISDKDNEIINANYKNQHELNQAIEKFINDEEYKKYRSSAEIPTEVKEWLKKYSGAGGVEKQGAEGKGLLSEYYTPHNIVKKMWDITSQYIDTNGAKVLEPSVGVGRFLEHAPKNTSFDVVEMNPVSARITKLLYPDANVTTGEFQEKFIDKSKNMPIKKVTPEYDIVIGNPPYGQYSGKYKGLGEGKNFARMEAYFINRGLDSLKENGIMSFIVPSSFLDGAITIGKQEIGKKCELVDAYRLPEKTFDTTSIGTDIVVLRKTTKGNANINLGKWFEEHPEKILGNIESRKNRFGKVENFVKGDKNAVENIDTSKKDIKETVITEKTTTVKNTAKNNQNLDVVEKVKTKNIKGNVEYTEYQHENKVSERERELWENTRVDGSLPKIFKAGKDINQYEGKLYNDFNYLQGDIYEKLEQLEREDISSEQKEIQKKKLEAVKPQPKKASEIRFNPTSDFIQEFELENAEQPRWGKKVSPIVQGFIDYIDQIPSADWRDDYSSSNISAFIKGERVKFRINFDSKSPEYAREKSKKMSKLKSMVEKYFTNYVDKVLDKNTKERLVNAWNRNFNNTYNPDYTKMPLLVQGLNSKFKGQKLELKNTQVEGINFLTNKGVGLLGFEVGVGKTLTGIIATVQNMQMGRCKRPLIIIPKNIKKNWKEEFAETFPNLKVVDVDNMSKWNGEIEDGTITLATYQALDNIWYNKTDEQLTNMIYETGNNFNKEITKRGSENVKARFEKMIGKALKGNKAKFNFEDLGFDHVTFDEAHAGKNLFDEARADSTEMSADGKSMGNNSYFNMKGGRQSKVALRMFLLTQHILNANNNRNVFMLTATPFNNQSLEVFNMLSYLAKDKLDKMGLYNVYQFNEHYIDVTSDIVLDANNNPIEKQVELGFKNADTLREIIKSCMLIRTADEAGVVRPNKSVTRQKLDATEEQLYWFDQADEMAMNRDVEGALFKSLSMRRNATISPDVAANNYDVSPEEFIKNSPKLNYIMQCIESMKKKDAKTSQLIYMPIGVKFLGKIKDYLVNKGVYKSNEIEIISSENALANPEKEEARISKITDSFNDRNGDVKLIIGTQKIQVGMNLNKNTSTLYIPYVEWNPTDYVQTVGRMWRQGNRYNNVRVVVPLLKNSSDSFMFQKLDEKIKRMNDLMGSDKEYISNDDLQTEEEKIAMISNPAKRAKMYTLLQKDKINFEIKKLKAREKVAEQYKNNLQRAKNNIDYFEKEIKKLEDIKNTDGLMSYQEERLKDYKKSLNYNKKSVDSINAQIELDNIEFEGKDSPEAIKNKIDALEEDIKKLDELEEKKKAEYSAEYDEERKNIKSIEEHIKEFEKEYDNLYGKENSEELDNKTNYYIKKDLDNADNFIKTGKNFDGNIENLKVKDLAVKDKDLLYLIKDGKGDIPVKILDNGNMNGGFDFENQEIIFYKNRYDKATAKHEFQHLTDYKPEYKALFIQASELAQKVIDFKKDNAEQFKKIIDNWKKNEKKYNYNIDEWKKTLSKEDLTFCEKYDSIYNDYKNHIVESRGMKAGKGKKLLTTLEQDLKYIKINKPEEWRKYNYGQHIMEPKFNGSGNRIWGSFAESTQEKRTPRKTYEIKNEFKENKSSEEVIFSEEKIKEKAEDKIYKWHGNIGKDRFDVDKHLNSFINTSKAIAKEYTKKLGIKVTDKMVREILPFLRERTDLPKKLNRPELSKLFYKLSGSEKARLTKFADDVSNKFDKYYQNYQSAKGVEDAEGIENHISHIWDLDKKHKALLTNYFTTSSRFAKERTIDTLIRGIDGFEVNGELIQFKPKTLDYAEILKTSSDNLIKATHDMILADEIKNLKYNGKSLVMATSKAPSDWIEINHPALNKVVYGGTTKDDNLILRKGTVKVHPAVADKIKAIFEVQKPDNAAWKLYDNLNGLLKQSTLGFSGFHGYALSESAVSNMGIKNTIKSMDFKKIYNSVAKGDYEIFKKEEIVKKAMDDGLQIGTPSDLNRNQVEEFIGKIPVVGEFLKSAVNANNKVLWDCLHTVYKIDAYDYMVQAEGGYEHTTKQQRRAIAQWVNDSFGGQAWELLGVKKSTIKASSRLLLSPDWNFSTIRQTMGIFDTKKGNSLLSGKDNNFWKQVKKISEMLGSSETPGSNGARGKNARAFFLRFIIYSAIGYNLINAAFREKDREKHPELYPKNMSPVDYSIWGNISVNDKLFDKVFPYVFIGRNSDGSARYLRVGKQVREVPEMLSDPINKFGGKSSSLINLICQTALGISPADVPKKLLGKDEDIYYNQNIWQGYGKYAKRKEGTDLYKGMGKTIINSTLPFIVNKAIDDKHEMSAWDMFAQTSKGTTYGKAVRQYKTAYQTGNQTDIKKITKKAYQDGLSMEKIEAAKKAALKNYRADNTSKYKYKYLEAMNNNSKKEIQNITNQMRKNHLSVEEQRRIYNNAYKEYLKGGK